MPIQLNIKNISIPSEIPAKLGRQKVLKKLMDSLNSEWETKIIEDIKTLVSKFESLSAVEQNEILPTIEALLDSVLSLPESDPKKTTI